MVKYYNFMVIGRFTDSHFTDTENLVDGVDNAGQSVGEMAVGEMSEYDLLLYMTN